MRQHERAALWSDRRGLVHCSCIITVVVAWKVCYTGVAFLFPVKVPKAFIKAYGTSFFSCKLHFIPLRAPTKYNNTFTLFTSFYFHWGNPCMKLHFFITPVMFAPIFSKLQLLVSSVNFYCAILATCTYFWVFFTFLRFMEFGAMNRMHFNFEYELEVMWISTQCHNKYIMS